MASVDEQVRAQIRNIESASGRSMDEWITLVGASGRSKHGEIVAWLKSEHGFSHGNANRVAIESLRGPEAPVGDALVDQIYSGPKQALRGLHDRVIAVAAAFGSDVEQSPKQAYVALRRSKQFGTARGLRAGLIVTSLRSAGRLAAGR